MKLIKVKIIKAETCAGLLDGVTVSFRGSKPDTSIFDPLCLIGPNGTGKSQLLQVIAEIFQTIFHQYAPKEERSTANSTLEFEIEYAINSLSSKTAEYVRIFRKAIGNKKPNITFQIKNGDEWELLANDYFLVISQGHLSPKFDNHEDFPLVGPAFSRRDDSAMYLVD